jgi:uncharacterized protein YdeI (BOF family)
MRWPWGSVRERPVLALAGAIVAAAAGLLVVVFIASRGGEQGPKCLEDGTEGPQRFAISIGDQVVADQRCAGIGNIEASGATDVYTFTAMAGQVVYVDDQSTCGEKFRSMAWTVIGSDEQAVFDESRVCGNDVGGLALERGGSYSLTVTSDITGGYHFRLWDASQQRFSLKVGDRVGAARSDGAGNIETPGAADIYTFTATAGQSVYVDDQTDGDKSNWLTWTIVGTDGKPVFDNAEICGSDVGGLVLERGGSYSLTVKGQEDTTGTYSFRLWSAPQQRFRIRIGAQVQPGRPGRGAGNIETPGTADTYLFAATAGQVVYVDDQTACDSSFRSLVWTITGPDDQAVFDESRICGSDVGGLVLEQGGNYRLTVRGSEDTVGTYRFQLRGG